MEKIEENASLETYQFSYLVLNSYEQEIQETQKIKLSSIDVIASTERHWLFEKTIQTVAYPRMLL